MTSLYTALNEILEQNPNATIEALTRKLVDHPLTAEVFKYLSVATASAEATGVCNYSELTAEQCRTGQAIWLAMLIYTDRRPGAGFMTGVWLREKFPPFSKTFNDVLVRILCNDLGKSHDCLLNYEILKPGEPFVIADHDRHLPALMKKFSNGRWAHIYENVKANICVAQVVQGEIAFPKLKQYLIAAKQNGDQLLLDFVEGVFDTAAALGNRDLERPLVFTAQTMLAFGLAYTYIFAGNGEVDSVYNEYFMARSEHKDPLFGRLAALTRFVGVNSDKDEASRREIVKTAETIKGDWLPHLKAILDTTSSVMLYYAPALFFKHRERLSDLFAHLETLLKPEHLQLEVIDLGVLQSFSPTEIPWPKIRLQKISKTLAVVAVDP